MYYFWLRKLELAKLLNLNLPFDDFMMLVSRLSIVMFQNLPDVKQVVNRDYLFLTLRNYQLTNVAGNSDKVSAE